MDCIPSEEGRRIEKAQILSEALPYIRTMFVGSIGMLLFFMFGGALRAAGDAQTPLRLGVVMTILNVVFNVALIGGVDLGLAKLVLLVFG